MTTTKKTKTDGEETKTLAEKQYVHFMVDCETLGVVANKNHVLQLAAVKFNPETFEPELDSEGKIISFECFLPLVEQSNNGRIADPETVKWWGSADKAEVAVIVMEGVKNAAPMKTELLGFSQWISQECALKNGFAESVFWAKPVAFDYPIIDGLFNEYGVPSPFHFRKVVDMASHILSALKSTHYALNHYHMTHHIAYETYWAVFEKIKKIHKGRPNAHNASADCLFQLEWLKEVMDNCANYVSEKTIKETLSRKE